MNTICSLIRTVHWTKSRCADSEGRWWNVIENLKQKQQKISLNLNSN